MTEFFFVVVGISAPFLIGTFLVHYFRYRTEVGQSLSRLRAEMAALDNADLQAEVTALRHRIEALETIVTDQKYELGRTISRL